VLKLGQRLSPLERTGSKLNRITLLVYPVHPADVRRQRALYLIAGRVRLLVQQVTGPHERMPGMQKPHCSPPDATKERAKTSRSSSLSPSRVQTFLPITLAAGTAHEIIALALAIWSPTITVQHPALALRAAAILLGEIRPQCSRSTSSSEASGATSEAANFTVDDQLK
jgi:hypothetical protein